MWNVFFKTNNANSVQMENRPMKVFGLNSTRHYADLVCKHLGMLRENHTEKNHLDGELYVKSGSYSGVSGAQAGNVRGHDTFVIQSLYSDKNESVSDKFMKLCMFCGSLKDASAHEVIPVIPYLGWQRQDRKTESRAPICTKYVARMLESVGATRVLLFDVHNLSAEQNAFNVPIDNLEAKNLIADWCCEQLLQECKFRNIKILSPDSGGLSRCERFRNALLSKMQKRGVLIDDIEIVIFDKVRVGGKVKGGRIIGDVKNSTVIALDDMISTGETMHKAVKAVRESGGNMWAVCATHGIFCGKSDEFIENCGCYVVVTDTIDLEKLNIKNASKVKVVGTTKIVADAMQRIHSGIGSISELLSNS